MTIVSTDIAELMTAQTADEVHPQYRSGSKRSANVSLALGFLGGAGFGLSGLSTDTLVFVLGGTKREYVPEDKFDLAIDNYQRQTFGSTTIDPNTVITAAKFRPGSRYFIIRETILADTIDWTFDSQLTRRMGLSGGGLTKKLKIADSNVVESSRGNSISLVQRFSNAMRVYYRADEVKVLSAGDSGKWKADTTQVRIVVSAPPAPPRAGQPASLTTTSVLLQTADTLLSNVNWSRQVSARVRRLTSLGAERTRVELDPPAVPEGVAISAGQVINQEWSSLAQAVRQPDGAFVIDVRATTPFVANTIRNNQVTLQATGTQVQSQIVPASRIDTVTSTSTIRAGNEWTITVSPGMPSRAVVDIGGRQIEFDPAEVVENDYVVRTERRRLDNGVLVYTYELKASPPSAE